MIRDDHHLFINDEGSTAPSAGARLYFYPFSHDEDDATSALEFKEIALAAYEQAIRLAPYEAMLYYHKGQLLEQLGRATEAATAYEDAHRLGYQRSLEAKETSAIIDTQQGHS